jgi:hypothetical protein
VLIEEKYYKIFFELLKLNDFLFYVYFIANQSKISSIFIKMFINFKKFILFINKYLTSICSNSSQCEQIARTHLPQSLATLSERWVDEQWQATIRSFDQHKLDQLGGTFEPIREPKTGESFHYSELMSQANYRPK